MNKNLEAAYARCRLEYGDKFDPSDLEACDQAIQDAYRSGQRVKVQWVGASGETYERTGTVSMTTGWRPAFLLMHRSSDHGSSDVLGSRDHIVAVQDRPGGKYRPVNRSHSHDA